MNLRHIAVTIDEFTRKVLSSFWLIVLIICLIALFAWSMAMVE